MTTIKTTCARDCPDACFLDVEVKDGVVTSVRGGTDNPVTAGITCPRALGDPNRVYSMDRVLKPYLRGEEPGRFTLSTWDQALDLAAERLKATLETHGPGAVLLLDYSGNTGLITSGFSKRLWHALGATMTDYAVCSASGHAAIGLHYGLTYGVDPENLLRRKVIVFWGFNARHSSPHIWAMALRAKRESDAVIVVIDPRESESTSMADLWLYPRPGTDVALAYGLARYLITGGHVDEAFIAEHTHGYDQYRAEALRWTPERVETVTGVSWEGVEALGAVLVEYGSPVFMIGIGLNKGLAGAESVRAVSLLPALLGEHRGFYYSNSGRYNLVGGMDGSALTSRPHEVVSQIAVGEHLAAGEFKYVYVQTMNPALTLPDSRGIAEGLRRDDVFLVVHDTHLTETCDLADVVLPAPTYLEKDDIVLCDSHPYARKAAKAIEPEGESRAEQWVMKELARRVGVEEPWVYVDPWTEAAEALRDAFVDGDFDDFMRGTALRLRRKPLDAYQTPTGRIEFYSTTAGDGVSPLPEQIEFSVDAAEFIMLSSSVPKYLHTQFRDVYGEIPPQVWVNPTDAEVNNLGDGDPFTLVNEHGRLNVEAVVTDRVPRGVLWSPRELVDAEGNAQNSLTPGVPQRIGGGPLFNSTRVRIL
ncbi:molybdopterin-dependent oxidoreductase [Candidatus Bathyarchaeota archaeon]|nr:molybdopterin-dependent oxidoreductase [Candidatus Bathyarchaeota archaeon]